MNPEINMLCGRLFTHPETGEQFGCIRQIGDKRNHPARQANWTPIAEDECDNAFVVSSEGSVAFWNRETQEIAPLAPDWDTFVQGCAEVESVELNPSDILSVLGVPAFATEPAIRGNKECRNCSGTEFYSREVSFGGYAQVVLPIGGFRAAKCRARVCGGCGLVEWFLSPDSLKAVKEKYERES